MLSLGGGYLLPSENFLHYMRTDAKKNTISVVLNIRYNFVCTSDENLNLIETNTYLCHLQRHARDIVLTLFYPKVTIPVLWKWRHTGYIIGCTLEEPVDIVKVKREADGGLGACLIY